MLSKRKVPNPIVVGGDIHATVVANLHRDPEDPTSDVVASEFCSTSVTSAGDSRYAPDVLPRDNPHVRHANFAERGYTLLELLPDRCDVRLRVVDEKNPTSDVATSAAFTVEAGRPGPQAA
jgi:alkaline phosphatase D